MNKARLMEVLRNTTCLISKGARTQRRLPGIPVLLWGLMLHQQDPAAALLQKVDCEFIIVGVNQEQAEKHREEFIEFLESYPAPQHLEDGPSYKHLASVVGDDMTALRILGLGQTLGIWQVLLPDQFGVDPELREEAADLGLVVATGYKSQHVPISAVG